MTDEQRQQAAHGSEYTIREVFFLLKETREDVHELQKSLSLNYMRIDLYKEAHESLVRRVNNLEEAKIRAEIQRRDLSNQLSAASIGAVIAFLMGTASVIVVLIK